jgi:hypothetical protein
MKRTMAVVCMGAVISTFAGKAAPLFMENFGNLADGTALSANNTSLTYARAGAGAGAFLNARDPGSFSGSSAFLLATSTSLTGLGATNGSFAPFRVGTLSFSLRTPVAYGAGDLYATLGSGNSFSGNTGFSTAELTAGFLLSNGQLQTRNLAGAWENVGAPLAADSSSTLHIVFNGSTSSLSYGVESLGAGKADLWLNGVLWGDDVSIRNAVDVSAFRFYTTGNASALPYEIDDIQLFDSAVSVPEPSVLSLVMAAGFLAFAADRRKG